MLGQPGMLLNKNDRMGDRSDVQCFTL